MGLMAFAEQGNESESNGATAPVAVRPVAPALQRAQRLPVGIVDADKASRPMFLNEHSHSIMFLGTLWVITCEGGCSLIDTH
jgi:hypothetical protein